ncbi:MAG: GtrA family protein [Caulobacteraceae bacterium]|nr:GtrA family protein [Caulobacter sp.]
MSFIQSASEASARPRLAAPRGLFAFLAVGVVGLVVDLGLLFVLERAGLPLAIARAVSLPAATLVTWLLNRRHTFASSGRKAHHEALRYAAVAAAAQSVNYVAALAIASILRSEPHLAVAVLSLTRHMPHAIDMVSAFTGAVIATLFSYTGQRFFTFGDARPAVAAD